MDEFRTLFGKTAGFFLIIAYSRQKLRMAGVSASFLSGKIKKTEYYKLKTEKGENFHEEIESFRCVLLCVAKAIV